MAASAPIDELRHRYAAQPRRFLAPLANALRQSGALEEAVTMLRAQLAVYPDHLTGHVVLGQALFDTGALAESRAAFERAWGLDPGNRMVLQHLGEIASMAGDTPAARVWFGRLRTADPYADDVAAQLGGAATAPPGSDEDAPADAGIDAAAEVRERSPATEGSPASDDQFEVLDFAPAAVDESAFDPIVGLDVAPAALASELDTSAAVEPKPASSRSPRVAEPEGRELEAVTESRGEATAPARIDPASDDVVREHGEAEQRVEPLAGGAFATETMAGLLAAQGHTDQAIALYERLVAERPADGGLRERLDALRARATTPASNDVGADLAPAPAVGGDDAARGALLADAFGDLPGPVSDDAFEDVSFDQFFPADNVEPATVTRGEASTDGDADLARFDTWLRDDAREPA